MIRKTMRICGVRTSVKLELAFWTYLQAVAEQRGILLTQLVDEVAMGAGRNLASTLRVFCLNTAHARIADLEAALRATSRR